MEAYLHSADDHKVKAIRSLAIRRLMAIYLRQLISRQKKSLWGEGPRVEEYNPCHGPFKDLTALKTRFRLFTKTQNL
jgi:hypothetical protein